MGPNRGSNPQPRYVPWRGLNPQPWGIGMMLQPTEPTGQGHLIEILMEQYCFFYFYCCSSTVVSIFPPPLSPALLTPTSHPQSFPPFGFVHGSFIHVPWRSFPFFSPLFPSPLPSAYCQFVLYFHVSGSILLACLFCWLGSTYRWDYMVFIFHQLAYFTYHNALQFHPLGAPSFSLLCSTPLYKWTTVG